MKVDAALPACQAAYAKGGSASLARLDFDGRRVRAPRPVQLAPVDDGGRPAGPTGPLALRRRIPRR